MKINQIYYPVGFIRGTRNLLFFVGNPNPNDAGASPILLVMLFPLYSSASKIFFSSQYFNKEIQKLRECFNGNIYFS